MSHGHRTPTDRRDSPLLPGLPVHLRDGVQVREVPTTQATLRGLPSGFVLDRIVYQFSHSGLGLNVVVARDTAAGPPSTTSLRALHRWRAGLKNAPVVAAVLRNDGQWWLHGPDGDGSPVGPVSDDLAERMLGAALRERDSAAARNRIAGFVDSLARGEEGVGSHGLFATHYMRTVLPDRPEWESANRRASGWMRLRGKRLISALGFAVQPVSTTAVLLAPKNTPARRRAIAVLLNDDERFEGPSTRFRVSPVAHGLKVAQEHELLWVIALRKSQIRLYSAQPGVGVGSRGLAETFFELDLAMLPREEAAYLDLAFSEAALRPGGSVGEIIAGSARYATALSERLRQRIYRDAVPGLAVAVAKELERTEDPNSTDLSYAYRITLRILFRLLFQAYAEDRDLLPYGRNRRYDRISLKKRAEDLAGRSKFHFDAQSSTLWRELRTVWAAIDTGNTDLDVPAYNGGLFGSRPDLHAEGAAIERMDLTDEVMGQALRHLLVDATPDGVQGAIDFRDLTIREFGTIYEGLIGSTLSKAVTDLTHAPNGSYVPASTGDQVVVHRGDAYFHDTTQTRKATGTYFTPEFAVRHLLRQALDPALDHHLEGVRARLIAGDEASAAEAFFDFRVADIAMGSGHFLVGAIDHIEAKMSAFLAEESVPAVTAELRRLEEAARKALGPSASTFPIETSALLRRQIARRCIYGVDVSTIGVDLARVAVWLHTFVPGLPMSSLDHNLVYGNSLTGIDRIQTALGLLDPSFTGDQFSMFSQPIRDALQRAKDRLMDAAEAAEATKAEVERSAEALKEAMRDAKLARLLFDTAVGVRVGTAALPETPTVEDIKTLAEEDEVLEVMAELTPAHFPFLFPEVFLRRNGGFDVILGNPPWEKVKVEKQQWWGKLLPGSRGMSVGKLNSLIRSFQRKRTDLNSAYLDAGVAAKRMAAYLRATFVEMGSGDTDLYQAFAWRFWELLRASGYVGIVMPGSALIGTGLETWRRGILRDGTFDDVTTLINTGRWAFDMEARYAIALLTIRKGQQHSGAVRLRGPFHSLQEFEQEVVGPAVEIPTIEFRSWSANAALPSLPTARSLGIFRKLYEHPLLGTPDHAGQRQFRPHSELHAWRDKRRFALDEGEGAKKEPSMWPVYKGKSFDLWNPDTGTYYASVDPTSITDHLQRKRFRQSRNRNSVFHGLSQVLLKDPETLVCRAARIAVRLVTRATDSRTVRCALIPPDRVCQHGAQYFVRRGAVRDEAYILGIMSSIPFDWCARRFVDKNLTFAILNGLPVPQSEQSSPEKERLIELTARLAAHDDRFADWATEVGVPVGSLRAEPERADAMQEIDALVAHLYGLNADELVHIYETFHRGWDYQPRLEAVLRHFQAWESET